MSYDFIFRISNNIQNSIASLKSLSMNSKTLSTIVINIKVHTFIKNNSDDDNKGDGGDNSDNNDNSDGSNDYIIYVNGITIK